MAKIEASSASISTITNMLSFSVSDEHNPKVDYRRGGGVI